MSVSTTLAGQGLVSVSPNLMSYTSKIDSLATKKAAMILRAINHKLRLEVLKLLEEAGKMTVTEIYVKLRLEQSVASQHLAILRMAGFVITIREGKNIFYSVSNERIEEVQGFIKQLLGSEKSFSRMD